MTTEYFTYAESGFFAKIVTDYLAGNPQLDGLYKYKPEIESFTKAIADRQNFGTDRKVLVDVLTQQYSGLSGKPLENIKALASDSTFTVTTGHQLNLFTGPLYFIYKIITTIRLAEEIEKHNPTYKIVPVYWMATEDHDFAEINHIQLFGKKLTWEQEAAGATGRMSTAGMQEVLQELKTILGEGETAKEVYSIFESAYTQNRNLAAATRALVHHLFKEYGLVVIDADSPELKKQFASITATDIVEKHSYQLITATNKKIAEYYDVQVNPREINFFYLEENLRERIVQQDNAYRVNDTAITFTIDELAETVTTHPEKFSPNVVMRPLYQECILPNLAYIGGGAEIAYWLELQSTFKNYKVFFPALILRNSVVWIDEGSKKRMDKLQLSTTDLFKPSAELVKEFVKKNQKTELSLTADKVVIEQAFEYILLKGIEQDATLKGLIEGEKVKVINAVNNIEQRLLKAEKKKFETEIAQLEKLKEKFFPNNGLQERYDNVLSCLIVNPLFINELYASLLPLKSQITVVFQQNKISITQLS